MPKAFISYSWEDEEHKEWVKSLADRLIAAGIETVLDQYDLTLGDRLPQFMENSIDSADYVLIICTPNYKKKSDLRKGGVGYEGHIISGELLSKNNERKFIPVIRVGSVETAIPKCLEGKLAVDLSNNNEYEKGLTELITTIWGGKVKPQIGTKPDYVTDVNPYKNNPNEPVHILNIIIEEVTSPRNDGTPGCALYKIPFKLSKRPSELWKKLFIEAWNCPPRFTSMHRPGIAKVYGDKIILDGTTIEEVQEYHKETLILCVNLANKKEEQILESKRLIEDKRKMELENHYDKVTAVSKNIKFS